MTEKLEGAMALAKYQAYRFNTPYLVFIDMDGEAQAIGIDTSEPITHVSIVYPAGWMHSIGILTPNILNHAEPVSAPINQPTKNEEP
ncbi:MAG TPA: hypothetical protein VF077_00465 [Nitrospiraceae bacterium]